MKTLALHPELQLVGVMDRDQERAEHFAAFHSLHRYGSLDELLGDERVDIVLNLTNPKSHYEISKAALTAGKHVYSEKPLAMDLNDARQLVALADEKGLSISSAPCSLLSETAQSIWRALREERLGRVYLVYAELDDGFVSQTPYKKWFSESGIPWPYKDEFEVGCTLEHAGYCLTWLVAYFGCATKVTAMASSLVDDKNTGQPLDVESPDFSVACIEFESGVVARLTCSIVAPHDHSMRIIGDKGVLQIKDCWFYRMPVHIRRWVTIRRKTFLSPWKRRYPLLSHNGTSMPRQGAAQMDFMRGVAELADSIREKRPSRLSPDFCLHITELVLAIHHAQDQGVHTMTTRCDPVEPMPWASDKAIV